MTSVGLAFSLFIVLDFIDQLGKSYPIKQLIVMLASLQWIVGAKVSYEYGKIHYKYYMYVEEELFMSLVVPSVLLLYAGLLAIHLPNLKAKLDLFLSQNIRSNRSLKSAANVLLMIGLGAIVVGRMISIPSLSFVFFIMGLLVYVAIGYYFYIYPQRRGLLFLLIILVSFLQALYAGLFHNFLLVGVFLFAIYVNQKTSFLRKLTIIIASIVLINVIQVVKQDYRSVIWTSANSKKLEVFIDLIEKEYFVNQTEGFGSNYSNGQDEDDDIKTVTTRLNQGWIISKIMEHVPRQHEYLGGSTITDAFSASLLPRFLFPNKTGVLESKKVFENITGLKLINSTTMGLSLVGEFYANFGIQGAWIAMFLYGLFLSAIFKLLIDLSQGSPFLIVWFVLILFQVVKAETELMKVINHLVKSIIFFVVLKYLLNTLGVDLFPKRNTLELEQG